MHSRVAQQRAPPAFLHRHGDARGWRVRGSPALLDRLSMRRGTRLAVAVLGGVAVAAPLLYALSWHGLAREQGLYAFAADSVKVLGLDRWATSRVVRLDGFGGNDSAELRRLRAWLQAQGFQVCLVTETPTSGVCRDLPHGFIEIESRIESFKPFRSIVTLRWMDQGRGEEYQYGFWWNGVSWSRDINNDERLKVVTLTRSSELTTPPVLASRRVRGENNATRRAAERGAFGGLERQCGTSSRRCMKSGGPRPSS